MEDYRKIAIELGQTLISKAPETREDVERMLPELKESEDKKIRKALKQYFVNSFQNNGVAAICGVHIKDVLAWLEKQAQKPAEWSYNDDVHRDAAIRYLKGIQSPHDTAYQMKEETINRLKSMPQSHWKPDKAVIQILELIIQGKANPTNYQATLMNLVEQLKKLKG